MSSPDLPLQEEVQPAEEVESDQRGSLSGEDEKKKYVDIKFSISKELQCAICQGTIRNTRTLMECLHRFCKNCIEKSMDLGVDECPVCHVHVASRLSLKEDLNFDHLISALLPYIHKKKDQEKVALHDGGRTHDDESSTQVSDQDARRSRRIAKFIEHLRKSDVNDDELETHLVLVSLDEQRIPSLQEPHLSCKPTCSAQTLCKYIAIKAEVLVDQVELFLVEESKANFLTGEITVDPEKDKLRVLRGEETLAQLYTPNVTNSGHLIFGYKMK